jgi:hypothetical protein
MDAELIKSLASGRKPAKQGDVIIRKDGKLERVSSKGLYLGAFDAKAGTMRRSRKGQTTRRANGYARYAPNWEVEVIAYKLR